jgi:hypothetical protein
MRAETANVTTDTIAADQGPTTIQVIKYNDKHDSTDVITALSATS